MSKAAELPRFDLDDMDELIQIALAMPPNAVARIALLWVLINLREPCVWEERPKAWRTLLLESHPFIRGLIAEKGVVVSKQDTTLMHVWGRLWAQDLLYEPRLRELGANYLSIGQLPEPAPQQDAHVRARTELVKTLLHQVNEPARRFPITMSDKQIESEIKDLGFGLPKRGQGSGVFFSHCAAILCAVQEEHASLEVTFTALVERRANTIEDNKRWTHACVRSTRASRAVRACIESYFGHLDS
jgi:hypothetical protein